MIDLNHRYALDGRDPASYGGSLWCLGQFDRPFSPEQPILGTVRARPVRIHAHRTDIAAYEKRVDRGIASPSPRVAIIGTGLGGLMCARILRDHGLAVQLFNKSRRAGGRTSTRKIHEGFQFDHGAQYFTIRDLNLQRYLDSWVADKHVSEWHGQIVSINEPGEFNKLPQFPRYVGIPTMESLAGHLSTDLDIQFDTEVEAVVRRDRGYQLYANDDRGLGAFDIVLWNCPPLQTSKQTPSDCDWKERLSKVEMVPCWAVMMALERRWKIPLDGAFVNQGQLSWLARDSSKPARPSGWETWVLHSTVDWAKAHLEKTKAQVVQILAEEAERVTGSSLPPRCVSDAHRWLYARHSAALPEFSLWDADHWLGACGDWCGGPRVEGALKSGIALAGRVLGTLHENSITTIRRIKPVQLSLFNESAE